MPKELSDLIFQNSLIPVIVQDVATRDVLMLAWQNQEAIDKTVETKEMWFWSRSRQQLWHKGETSGNRLLVCGVRVDCDRDTLLYLVKPTGPACHTGQGTCFGIKAFSLAILEQLIASRKQNPQSNSYTNLLLDDPKSILEKIIEEAGEVVQAVAKHEGTRQITWEVSDLLYHLLVLLGSEGIPLSAILAELAARHDEQKEQLS